ncbi:MAG: EamA/RhaT family transporter [Chloroflexi bacterium]|nr:EamA/RhaT family transporter [Chloroflexota bacterium]
MPAAKVESQSPDFLNVAESPQPADTVGGSAASKAYPFRSAAQLGKADLFLLLNVLIWGLNFSIMKMAFREFLPLSFNGLRFALAAVTLIILVRLIEGHITIRREDWPAFVALGLIGNTLYQIFFAIGLDHSTAGNGSLILAISPVFVALLGSFLHVEQITRRAWLGIMASLLGMILVITGGESGFKFGFETLSGDLLILLATLCWAIYTIISKPLLSKYSPLALTAITMVIGTLALIPFTVPDIIAQDWTVISLKSWAALGYSFSMAIVLAYVIWSIGVQRLGGARTAVYSNLVPVVATALAYFLLGERLQWLQILGGIIIILGIILARHYHKTVK